MARGHYHSRKRRERATDVASFLLVILLAAGAMLPIWWIFRSSLMTNTELCASGDHRLEPGMLGLFDFASLSDAHECTAIPIVAANLHRVM